MTCGIIWAEEVIFYVIVIIKFSFESQLQDGRHMEIIFRFDLLHISAGVSVILTGILFKWINNSNDDDNDINSSSSRTTTTITTNKVRNYYSKLQRLNHRILGMDK